MKRLSEDDLRVWRKVQATVRPFAGRRVGPVAAPPGAPEPAPAALHRPPTEPLQAAPKKPGPLADASGARRVRRGHVEVEARLDLHGHGQDDAFQALASFLVQARAARMRTVLVITGKGRGGAGVLRSRLLDWIASAELRPLVATYAPAHQKHGGSGAFYLFLKASRSPASA
jgi:DNA-nicking Smr family endonuclease